MEAIVDKTPHGHWETVTYICGLRCDGIVAPHAFVGAMNTERFLEYLRDYLLPALRRNDIVVMDNLSSHKSLEVAKLLKSAGVELLYLPAYSPDLNSIELSFSKLKSVLRKEKIRDVSKLQDFLQTSPQLFTPTECNNYFQHDGYAKK